ncbi:MAG: hypothetical protein ACK528_05365, partial [Alphaproteobacteria bacterium]
MIEADPQPGGGFFHFENPDRLSPESQNGPPPGLQKHPIASESCSGLSIRLGNWQIQNTAVHLQNLIHDRSSGKDRFDPLAGQLSALPAQLHGLVQLEFPAEGTLDFH